MRVAAPGDAESLTALAMAAKAHWGYSAEALAAWKDQLRIHPADVVSKPTYVAAIGAEIAGFYSLDRPGEKWDFGHLWVAPRFMRRGVGRALIAHALETASRGGASSVTVDADPNAEDFYVSCGAVRCGEVPAPIPGQPDRIRPQLVFNEPAIFWQRYLATLAFDHRHRRSRLDSFSFGDSPSLANQLGGLVMAGRKRATASLPVEFTSLGLPMPAAGDVSVVLMGDGKPAAVIELVEVRHVPFGEVDEKFAADEGEGDRTLRWWRDAHREYFGRVSARDGVRFDETTPVICQRFRVLWPATPL